MFKFNKKTVAGATCSAMGAETIQKTRESSKIHKSKINLKILTITAFLCFCCFACNKDKDGGNNNNGNGDNGGYYPDPDGTVTVFARNMSNGSTEIYPCEEVGFMIDNYLDESVLMLLAKRNKGVRTTIYTKAITPEIQLDLQRHNAQYPEIFIEEKQNIHDRFLLIDNDVYHIGASFKDLGKKLFAFSKMGKPAGELLKNI